MEKKTLTIGDLHNIQTEVEQIILKIDAIKSVTEVSRAAFENKDVFSTINPEDVARTFDLLSKNLEAISTELYDIIGSDLGALDLNKNS